MKLTFFAMNKTLTKEQVFQKIKQYCIYQERSHAEVKEKLYLLGLHKNDVEQIVSQLIEENYLNEERFAIQYAGGKFRMKQWGRVKIRFELKQRNISGYCIKKAMTEIEDEAYQRTLNDILSKKLLLLKGEKNVFIKKRKLQDYLLQKGFEADLIHTAIHNSI